MNEIVKYSNELHELKFNSLTEAQQNVFFTLLQQFRSTDGYTLELDYCKIFKLANIAESGSYRKEILAKLRHIQTFTFMYETNSKGDLAQEIIFPKIETDSENRILKIKVSKNFKDRYIDSPLKGWTRYELAEFVNLSGTYAKTIYRYLKQFRAKGWWRVKYKDFKELLEIPESYQALAYLGVLCRRLSYPNFGDSLSRLVQYRLFFEARNKILALQYFARS